jgi:hypothetical protein
MRFSDRQHERPPGFHTDVPHVQLDRAAQPDNRRIRATIDAPSPEQGHDFSRIPAHASDMFARAQSEHGQSLSAPLRARVGGAIEGDLRNVRVHAGPASQSAASLIGARAFTVGSDIYLGRAAQGLPPSERDRLLTHEAVHTVQQGGRPAAASPGMRISAPGDSSEVAASGVAAALSQPGTSRSLALRDAMRGGGAAPHVQRDLPTPQKVKDGTFDLDMKTISVPGGKSELRGTIKFTPSAAAPDSKSIKLLQVARIEDLTTGSDFVWTGDEADKSKVQTTADKTTGVEGGYFVDHLAKVADPRTKKTDARVSPYYRTYWPNTADSQDGSKSGKTIKEASLWDFPGWSSNGRFSFETAAKATDTGYHYATLTWGFTISDAAKGTVEKEYASANRAPSKTFGAAVKAFDEFYKNPGASTAPK